MQEFNYSSTSCINPIGTSRPYITLNRYIIQTMITFNDESWNGLVESAQIWIKGIGGAGEQCCLDDLDTLSMDMYLPFIVTAFVDNAVAGLEDGDDLNSKRLVEKMDSEEYILLSDEGIPGMLNKINRGEPWNRPCRNSHHSISPEDDLDWIMDSSISSCRFIVD